MGVIIILLLLLLMLYSTTGKGHKTKFDFTEGLVSGS